MFQSMSTKDKADMKMEHGVGSVPPSFQGLLIKLCRLNEKGLQQSFSFPSAASSQAMPSTTTHLN
jgi:hypothetical protein